MFPFLTSYDPPGSSEGSLDPLGLYQISDQLAVLLVPAVRERMQRIRFLTAMAVGAFVVEGLEDDVRHRDASPFLAWEWLVVEALLRTMAEDEGLWGVPGSLVAARAIGQHGYLDARSYLKTPRIFGFHGVYKRLANHFGVVDVHLGPGPNAERLFEAWARDRGLGGVEGAKETIARWRRAVQRSLSEAPPRTKPGWAVEDWRDLAEAFAPFKLLAREKRCLRDLLLAENDRSTGALPTLWEMQPALDDGNIEEEAVHNELERRMPGFGPLLSAIRSYEDFARGLQDGFDVLKAEAAARDVQGYPIPEIARDEQFIRSVGRLHARFAATQAALGEAGGVGSAMQGAFAERFREFSEPMDAATLALTLCRHHEAIQRKKSAAGKRPWFDRLGPDRVFIRHAYREEPRDIQPGRYVHTYRTLPVRRFYQDLS